MKTIIFSTLTASMIALGGVATAASPPLPIRGTIDAVNSSVLSVTEASGTYVGTAAIKQPSDIYRALELQVFPASMRGIGLGTRQWNLAPHSTMTNGTVGGLATAGGTVGTVSGSGDLTLTVNDGSGTKTVLVPNSVPVVTYTPGSTADLYPGEHFIFFPSTATSDALTTSRINVEKNGLTPPM